MRTRTHVDFFFLAVVVVVVVVVVVNQIAIL